MISRWQWQGSARRPPPPPASIYERLAGFDESHATRVKAEAMTRAAHAIEVAPFGGRVRVRVGEEMVADTAHALLLQEGTLPPVFYIPREDVRIDHFTRSSTTSHCPFKGDASYFDVGAGGRRTSDAAWSYETPLAAVSQIAGHLAFYPDKAEIETLPFG